MTAVELDPFAVPAGVSVGIGVDIEAVDRWEDPDPSLFTDEEHAYCQGRSYPAEAYAGTWCAKEAVVKAVMPSAPILTRQVRISRDGAGAPSASLPEGWPVRVLISISHSTTVSVAVAVAVSVPMDEVPGH